MRQYTKYTILIVVLILSLPLVSHIVEKGGFPYIVIRLSGLFNANPFVLTRLHKSLEISQNISAIRSSCDVLIIGDSYVEYLEKAKSFPNAIYFAIPGDITSGVIDRIDSIPAINFKRVIVIIGLNDLSIGLSPSKVAENKIIISNKLHFKFPQSEITICDILPINTERLTFSNFVTLPKIVNANKIFRYKLQGNVKCPELYKYFKSDSSEIKKEFYENDGIHLNRTGCKLFFDLLSQNI